MQTALSGMNAATAMVETTAHNLANLQTPGFKQSQVQLATAPPLGGVTVVGDQVDPSQGPLVPDDSLPLLALEGQGLFILEGPSGERLYTRDGQFSLNARGELVTAGGDRVLGFAADRSGQLDTSRLVPLSIRLGQQVAGANGQVAVLRGYAISTSGRITGRFSDGTSRTLGQLRLARFANPAGLAQRAGNKFARAAASGEPIELDPEEGGAGQTLAGFLEQSNVDLGSQLIDLTLAGTMFRANAAVFRAADEMLSETFFPWRR